VTALVLFDFDGTLNDTWRLYLESFRRALAPRYGRVLTDDEILALQPCAERQFFKQAVAPDQYDASYDEFLAHYRELHAAMNDGVYAGVPAMIGELRRRGCRLGVVTGKSRRAWDLTFPTCGFDAFEVVVTDDDVSAPKPAPEGLHLALERAKVDPAQALYVGDSLVDARAAEAAGMRFGAALWSKHPTERAAFIDAVRAVGPTLLFHEPPDVVRHVAG
jgi:HAD superfamily hydrolase (TIGR01509 family)